MTSNSFISVSSVRPRAVGRILPLLIAACLFFEPASASQPQGRDLALRHREIRSALDRREYDRVWELLESLKRSDPKLFALNNYEYLQARVAESRGDEGDASNRYSALADAGGPFAPYALKRLAALKHRQGEFKAEQQTLKRLNTEYPRSRAADGAGLKLAESYEHSENWTAAAAIYQAKGRTNREIQAKHGFALLKAGRKAEARAVFQVLVRGGDDSALAAAEELDRLGAGTLTEIEHLSRARLFLKNRHSDGAIRHFQAVVNEFPQSRRMSEALYGIGRAFYIREQWDEAIAWYARAHDGFPASPEGELGFYQTGHALQNAGRYKQAVAQYEAFLSAYPKSEYVGGAHLNAIDSLRAANDPAGALNWCDRAERRFAGEVTAATALFQRSKILLSLGKYGETLDVLGQLQQLNLGRKAPGATNFSEVAFLRGYCFEQLKSYPEALDAYLSLPDERNRYYGQRATQRLQGLWEIREALPMLGDKLNRLTSEARSAFQNGSIQAAKSSAHQALRLADEDAARGELLDLLRRCYRQLPAYSRAWDYKLSPVGREPILSPAGAPSARSLADELCFLGLYDEGIEELAASGTVAKQGGDANFSLAVYAGRGNRAWQAIDYAERILDDLPADFRLELMPREVAELLFPAPYRDELTQACRPRRLDPRLLLAIARQESRFRPWVKSAAAARGLFQFIDPTADQIAAELNMPHFTRDDLYDPRTAVRFGAQYVGNLFKAFPNHSQAVTAAYNGGESGVKRWLRRAGSADPDRFTIEVGYAETKDYVFIVGANYDAYRQLYKRDLTAKE